MPSGQFWGFSTTTGNHSIFALGLMGRVIDFRVGQTHGEIPAFTPEFKFDAL